MPPEKISQLIERFASNLETYKQDTYNETQLRHEFVDPFLESLGWDVNNQRGNLFGYQDVLHEDRVRVGRALKAPDYGFYIGKNRHFFLEAKKPAIALKYDGNAAFQLRSYAWSAKLPVSILTNFAEFAVYDGRILPDATDHVSKGRLLYLTFQDYPAQWDTLAEIFSRDAVANGSLQRYIATQKVAQGMLEVDVAFLMEIEGWRSDLASNIHLLNHNLNEIQINTTVQQTIDRLVFLRICEDRGLETYGRLLALQNGGNIYGRLTDLFRQADDRYNSSLFHFTVEANRAEEPDSLSLQLLVSDEAIKKILDKLYNGPYRFDYIPTEILGQVYEQFLGKVINLRAGYPTVEEKPEVKKAGGVYYTPTYIVEYIVEQTVGQLLAESTEFPPTLHVLDPACGSGSFLLGAYQYLLDWYLAYYMAHEPEQWSRHVPPPICETIGEVRWRLTIEERKRILLAHLHGVDIDHYAIEVTKLSLLIKVLEGETEETIRHLPRLKERVLPDLGRNVKCGNSLIGQDIYESVPQIGTIDAMELYRINAFDWIIEFAEIMQAGGFNVVMGNPPYVRAARVKTEKEYYKQKFSAAHGAYDIYVLFIEQALALARENGLVGLITPNKYFVADYAKKIRQQLLHHASIVEIADLGKCKSVFATALISTAITILAKAKPADHMRLKILNDDNVQEIADVPSRVVPISEIVTKDELIRVYQTVTTNSILEKITAQSEPLSQVAQVRTGVMGFDYWAMDRFIADSYDGRRIATNSYLDRYKFLWGKKVNLYKREVFAPRLSPTCDILSENTLALFAQQKIVVRGVARRLTAMLDEEGIGLLVAVHSVIGEKYDNKFLLGLLNSKLCNWIHLVQFYSARIPEGSLRYPVSFFNNLPIRIVDFNNPTDNGTYRHMIGLVERMIELHHQLDSASLSQAITVLKRQIEATDRQIDSLVYKLYGLTAEEIKIVEGK